jgi:hypothetical protein
MGKVNVHEAKVRDCRANEHQLTKNDLLQDGRFWAG